ncbi:MAG: hypothetical protein R3C09_06575 [Pirellulaceae bacterium]
MRSLKTKNVRLLADLFHMNIEEANVAQGLRDAGQYLGHVHFVDSNRRAAGLGHTDFGPIAATARAQLRWICLGRSLSAPRQRYSRKENHRVLPQTF